MGILVGYLEELEVQEKGGTGPKRVLLRHRDPAGKLYTVGVDARHVISHNLDPQKGRSEERTVFRFPKLELAAFMDGDVLRLCPRGDVLKILRGRSDAPVDGDQLV